MEKVQTLETVRESERERATFLVKRNVELFDTLTCTGKLLENKQANVISFINSIKKVEISKSKAFDVSYTIKKADYMHMA